MQYSAQSPVDIKTLHSNINGVKSEQVETEMELVQIAAAFTAAKCIGVNVTWKPKSG